MPTDDGLGAQFKPWMRVHGLWLVTSSDGDLPALALFLLFPLFFFLSSSSHLVSSCFLAIDSSTTCI